MVEGIEAEPPLKDAGNPIRVKDLPNSIDAHNQPWNYCYAIALEDWKYGMNSMEYQAWSSRKTFIGNMKDEAKFILPPIAS